jgi:hypothetical protein
MLLDAAIYGLDHGSQMPASPFDYLFHTMASYLPFFKTLTLITFIDADVAWALDVSLLNKKYVLFWIILF